MSISIKRRNAAVASAVAIALSGSVASAAILTATQRGISSEVISISGTGNNFQSPVIDLTMGQNYDNGDFVKISFVGGSISDVDIAQAVSCSSGGADRVNLAYHSHTTSYVQYRATGRSADTTNAVCRIAESTIDFLASSLGSTVTATSTGLISGSLTEFDATTVAETAFAAFSQFTARVSTPLDGVIDVEQGRAVFTNGRSDALTIDFRNDGSLRGHAGTTATAAEVAYVVATVTGDFAFVNDDGVADCQLSDVGAGSGTISVVANSAGNAVVSAGVVAISSACNSITVKIQGQGNPDDVVTSFNMALTFQGTSTSTQPLVAGSFGVATSVEYVGPTGSAGSANYAAPSGGAWTYSGFVAVVPFMPIQTGYTNTVYLSNRSSQSGGNITVTAYNAGATPCAFTLTGVSPAANGSVNIGGRIRDQIRNCTGMATGNLRTTLVITSPLPNATMELVTQYTDTATSRTVTVPNSSTDYR